MKPKHILIGVGVAVAAVILLELLTSLAMLFSILIGIAVGGAITVFLIASSRGEHPQDVVREVRQSAAETFSEPKTTIDERRANEQLLRSATAFVVSATGPDLVPDVQKLSDQIRELLPRALQYAPTSEMTYRILSFADTDFPEQLNRFTALSASDREAKKESFRTQLSVLAGKLAELVSFIDQGRAAEYEAQATFINLKL